MIAASRLVIVVIIFDIERRVLWHFCCHAAAQGMSAIPAVFDTLGIERLFLFIPGCFTVLCIKIAIGVHTGHIIHGGGHRGLDPGIEGSGIQGHPSPIRRCR